MSGRDIDTSDKGKADLSRWRWRWQGGACSTGGKRGFLDDHRHSVVGLLQLRETHPSLQATILRDRVTIYISRVPAIPPARRPSMCMFETAASSVLAIAAQALVVGVIISAL
ncbi:MAG: hypothetical protein NDI74_14630 [Sphingomonas sp.]|jgi:hypothetical protein|uniref:hypothetical protein n=1 Tax=Sphingomonas TaxID=13687 RepID=UPI0011AB2EFF|nr:MULTISPECIES: hypothetical protein [Sphingomonas]MBX8844133.1 hypothetical protein [Sphingomonas melonis]MBX8852766.1 hypothetical protein [Sphingomonas melonis]MBX8897475.1 hypothetical protein [Sphingomonas melonis]MCM2300645.1 hypothetical protein [Sphingomonas sp.]MCP4025378.1 hypothetical protein [Sphingomonas sp.]